MKDDDLVSLSNLSEVVLANFSGDVDRGIGSAVDGGVEALRELNVCEL